MLDVGTLKTLFDYNDGKLFWKVRPSFNVKVGDEAGSFGGEYFQVYIRNQKYKLHRVIFAYHHGYLPEVVDHIDGDTTNNHIENLREATVMKNRHNSKAPTTNKSGAKGVSYDKNLGKWRVRITVDKVRHDFGKFEDLEEAIKSASEAYTILHREFKRD